MEEVLKSCKAAAEYPKNLIRSNTYEFIARSYFDKLEERQYDLFHDESRAALEFWDFGDSARTFWPTQIRTPKKLEEHLHYQNTDLRKDPKCRFIFVHAPHSRERLYTTRFMLMLSLTYHQVVPAFLDFVLPFGKQTNERGFHFGGFRYQTRLLESERGLQVPELGWSGWDYRLCFNLKSVEQARGGGEPWSIRQAAIHHSFDIESGQASWVVVKANKLLQSRIKSATGSQGVARVSSFETLGRAFVSTLNTHLIFCEWSAENWRWYIDSFEESLQNTTRRTLSPIVRTPTSPTAGPDWPLTREQTLADNTFELTALPINDQSAVPSGFLHSAGRTKQIPQHTFINTSPEISATGPQFSFTDLQRTQSIEERANAAMLVLKNNVSVFTDLRKYYRSLPTFQGWPSAISTQCEGDISRFEQNLLSVENEMQLQLSRIQTLLHLIADRKSLLYGLLNSQNTEANKESTDYMQRMTKDMHDIAVKTKQETISMRIITFVTLCFLPGTFISVGLTLTLMSTDIIRFPDAKAGPLAGRFSPGALRLYLLMSLPLVFITLAGWYLFYMWEVRHRDQSPGPRPPGRCLRVWRSARKRIRGPSSSILPT